MHPNDTMPENHKRPPHPLEAPAGYFEQFNSRLAARLPVQPVRRSKHRYWAVVAAAAALAIPTLYWVDKAPLVQTVAPALVLDTTAPASGLRLDDETLANYLQEGNATDPPADATVGREAALPVSNASLLSEEDLLRAGLLRAEEFETFDPML